LKLVNLESDIQEQNDLSLGNPDKLQELNGITDRIKKELGDNDMQGSHQRPPGWIDNPQNMIMKK
jgi:hypothetical protein